MTNYFIDYENVMQYGLTVLQGKTKPEDHVYLFFTKSNPMVSMPLFNSHECSFHFLMANTGKESLDRFLLTKLGNVMQYGTEDWEYVIVSNDAGYDCVLGPWRKRGYKLKRMKVDLHAEKFPQASSVCEKTALNNKLQKLLIANQIPGEQIGSLVSFTLKNQDYKLVIYRRMLKELGRKKGLDVYHQVVGVLDQVMKKQSGKEKTHAKSAEAPIQVVRPPEQAPVLEPLLQSQAEPA